MSFRMNNIPAAMMVANNGVLAFMFDVVIGTAYQLLRCKRQQRTWLVAIPDVIRTVILVR